ncbi:Small conductance calcium-activated potassium channel protein 3 [Trichostrongylus colubriformis]|uniref:Small conductance calcium-activated potassium channel protein 3 n=1 Tax=Trichostrongylus colubriformis TaxID=6319 RepID=A0AAN8G4P3_TRICO
MTTSQRQELWGTALHHSFERKTASVSSDSLYNSCTDLHTEFRQQRKRRAGISGVASIGSALGGRSPHSSFDSNTDVAQISMNWMRMNGLGQGGFRQLLSGNPAVAKSTTNLGRVSSLRKTHGISSPEDRVPAQPCIEVIDGDVVSKKSVSIAFSNDLEAQKVGDDSEIPLMEGNEETISGGRLIKREILHDKRRHMSDRALFFAIVGIVLMIIENELNAAGVLQTGSLSSLCLKSLIIGSTIVLLVLVAYFHIIEVQLFMNANAADDWRVALTLRRMAQIGAELFICALCPLPFEYVHWSDHGKVSSETLHSLNIFVSIAMFLRLYWLCRVMLLHSRLFTDASSRSIAGLNRVNFNARFILKTLMTLCPGKMLMIFTAFLWIMAGWILRLCERDYAGTNRRARDMDYISSIWMVAITFLSVGYGDIVPHTNCGRTMAVITGILGTCASSMVVAVVARKLELTRAEKHVHNFMMDTQLTKKLKHSAANVLRETWLIYKFRKKVEKVDYARIRQHQRKFLVAIYEMRKVKRDQRKLAENFVSLGDIAKTSSNTYDLIQDVHSTQTGLSLRITAIEHQLGDISREISALSEMMRSRKRSETSESDQSLSHTTVVRRRREAVIP